MFTALYKPQQNPTERNNRFLKTMIWQFVDGNHRHWSHHRHHRPSSAIIGHLSEFRLAVNSAFHDSTGYIPEFFNFWRELRIPLSVKERRALKNGSLWTSVWSGLKLRMSPSRSILPKLTGLRQSIRACQDNPTSSKWDSKSCAVSVHCQMQLREWLQS